MKFLLYLTLLCSTLFASPYVAKNYDHLMGMQGFGDSLLKIHFKLYEGYVKNANDLLSQLQTMQTGSYEYGALKRRFGWEFDGMRLHELYFDHLGGTGVPDKKSSVFSAISSQFGSFEKWKQDFISTGMMRGIGWAVLYFDPQVEMLINVWINEHDTGHLATGSPIVIMDVFEHAYMPQYGLERAKYIEAFFANLDWKVISARYERVSTK